MGWDRVAVVWADDLSEDEARGFALADNRVADLGDYDDRELLRFLTDRRFDFVGRLNDDVNTYVTLGNRGNLFFTVLPIMVDVSATQAMTGGMTETYTDSGTYAKAFTTVMMAPSCVDVTTMGWRNQRIHHNVRWNNAVPKIISGTYAKHPNPTVH